MTRSDSAFPVPSAALLGPYAAAPLAAAAMLFDRSLGQGALWNALPFEPRQLVLIAILFDYPHVVASLASFADRQYLAHYRGPLLATLAVALAVVGGLRLGGFGGLALALVATANVYHLLMQQVGIGRRLLGASVPPCAFRIWRAAVLAFGFAQLGAMSAKGLAAPDVIFACEVAALLAVGAATITLIRVGTRRNVPRLGLAHLVGTQLMLIVVAIAYQLQYYFFALLVPRIVHDLTAFAFYVAHDARRNALTPAPNLLHRIGRSFCLPSWLVTLGASIGLARLLAQPDASDYGFAEALTLGILLAHYGIEGLIWKRGTPHTKALSA